MNYFTHGRRFLHDPYFVAGTAVPDWLRVADRTNRVRSKTATPWAVSAVPHIAAVANGILQHLHDDQWFHGTRAFVELSWEFTRRIRDLLGHDASMRPSFVGHILVEMLLDAELAALAPESLDRYYQALRNIDISSVCQAVDCCALRPARNMAALIDRFCADPFLYDYSEDGKLLRRLNMVMRRVGLPELSDCIRDLLPDARVLVRLRRSELLSGECE
ncbi:MAG: hypothetical protein FJ295_09895 [Planctomycetes bacterium]|nr:hypothetical protein [Planctomycetota bacterium]